MTRISYIRLLTLLIILLAFFLRVWRLDQVPPGWSDDELSNALVMAPKVLAGDYSVYYVDATGHEALYHVLAAGFLSLFGANIVGIRLLSVILGTLAVPLTYQVGRRLFNRNLGLLASAALALSFWSLVYSRIGLRHVSLPFFMLLSFTFFWKGLRAEQRRLLPWALSGLFLGLGFYTYFASRGIPLILLAFVLYLLLFARPLLRRHWRGIALVLVVALVLAIPLAVSLARQADAGADARVTELAVPLVEASRGNFSVLADHVVRTLSMFHSDGDDEFLYNIPYRPVFGPIGAFFFWAGVLVAFWYALQPLLARLRRREEARPAWPAAAAAFLLLWWLAGISPAFLSVPAGSLSHNIVAQPATFILAALPLFFLEQRLSALRTRRWLLPALSLLLLGSIAARDLPDYFANWPSRGNVRFLYHADLRDVAHYLARHPDLEDFAISGLLAGPWASEALAIDLENVGRPEAQPRWYDPRRAIFLELAGAPAVAFTGFPQVPHIYSQAYDLVPGESAGGYQLGRVKERVPDQPEVCFRNNLCLVGAVFEPAGGHLHLTWQVAAPLDLPPAPLIAKPPPPDVHAGPRLYVFGQLLDEAGQFLAGDDGIWVDPATLRPGDLFRQQHHLLAPPGSQPAAVAFGLYDPVTGERVLTEEGQDHLQLALPEE